MSELTKKWELMLLVFGRVGNGSFTEALMEMTISPRSLFCKIIAQCRGSILRGTKVSIRVVGRPGSR